MSKNHLPEVASDHRSAVPAESVALAPGWLEVVSQSVGKLKYGSVQIVVHDARVTLVESVERTRIQVDRIQSRTDAI